MGGFGGKQKSRGERLGFVGATASSEVDKSNLSTYYKCNMPKFIKIKVCVVAVSRVLWFGCAGE